MTNQQLNEADILSVAREIRKPKIRARYLGQVCHDPDVRHRLEQQVAVRRRWQIGLRSLFVIMVFAAIASTFLGISVNSALRAQRLAEMERRRAMQAAEQARAAMLQLEAAQSKGTAQ